MGLVIRRNSGGPDLSTRSCRRKSYIDCCCPSRHNNHLGRIRTHSCCCQRRKNRRPASLDGCTHRGRRPLLVRNPGLLDLSTGSFHRSSIGCCYQSRHNSHLRPNHSRSCCCRRRRRHHQPSCCFDTTQYKLAPRGPNTSSHYNKCSCFASHSSRHHPSRIRSCCCYRRRCHLLANSVCHTHRLMGSHRYRMCNLGTRTPYNIVHNCWLRRSNRHHPSRSRHCCLHHRTFRHRRSCSHTSP